jgi:hypothetical protein
MKEILVLLSLFIYLQNAFGQTVKTDPSNRPQLAFNKFMADYTSKHDFNGTILVEQNGNKIYNESFGLAHFQFHVPIQMKQNTK